MHGSESQGCLGESTCLKIKWPYTNMRSLRKDALKKSADILSAVDIVEISRAYNCTIGNETMEEYMKYEKEIFSKELIQASKDGKFDRVKELINLGASLDEKDEYGKTGLNYAEEMGHTEIVDFLKGNHSPTVVKLSNQQQQEVFSASQTDVYVFSTKIQFGKVTNNKLSGFGIQVINENTKYIIAGDWINNKLNKGIILFPQNMSMFHFEKENIKETIAYIDSEEPSFKCMATDGITENCLETDKSIFLRPQLFRFPDFETYFGQLGTNEPLKKGFGKSTKLDEIYKGFWSDNKKNKFGVLRDLTKIYAGEFNSNWKMGAGAELSVNKQFRTIFVGSFVYGQANGPAVFIYPDWLLYFGNFYDGKSEEGVWIDKDFNVLENS